MSLRKTCLHDLIVANGGRMVGFSGWEMPVQFSGIIDEHLAVRRRAGLFDVSHMGQFGIRGPGSGDLLQRLTTNDVSRLAPGKVQYTILSTPEGTVLDDILISQTGEQEYLLCVNAANEAKDFAWIREHAGPGISIINRSSEFGLLALQGPRAEAILRRCIKYPLDRLRGFHHVADRVADRQVLISRTGYTGEDGFELYCDSREAPEVWSRLLESGSSEGLVPVGLGARDTLRLEARLLLCGSDMDESTTVLEAGLQRFVKLKKEHFLGCEILRKQSREGLVRKLVGFEMSEPGIPRKGYRLFHSEEPVGRVTSGGPAPFLKKNIGLGYLPIRLAEPGTEIQVEIRGQYRRARTVKGPFYRRPAPGGNANVS